MEDPNWTDSEEVSQRR